MSCLCRTRRGSTSRSPSPSRRSRAPRTLSLPASRGPLRSGIGRALARAPGAEHSRSPAIQRPDSRFASDVAKEYLTARKGLGREQVGPRGVELPPKLRDEAVDAVRRLAHPRGNLAGLE